MGRSAGSCRNAAKGVVKVRASGDEGGKARESGDESGDESGKAWECSDECSKAQKLRNM